MSRTYARHVSRCQTPQSEPIPGTSQQENHAGGYSYVLDDWGRLQRFLILGSEGGTYYVGERKLTQENATCITACAEEDPARTVETICQVSEAGRAPKNDPAIFALALVASRGNNAARNLALVALPRVCRIGTHLFQFLANCKELRGWGRGLREAVAAWYNDKSVEKLAYQVTKYRNRVGYTHRDALRLSHPTAADADHNALYRYIVKGATFDTIIGGVPDIIIGFEAANQPNVTEKELIGLIGTYGLTLEHVPNTHLGSPAVWEALLPNLPPTALIRNLGKMTSIGLLKPLSRGTQAACETLRDLARLKAARVHPLSVLLALDTYGRGHGLKGSLTWDPVAQIRDALEDAFYLAFDAVEPSGKRHLLALDVSGSMTCQYLANTGLDARKASACMAMVTLKSEPQTHLIGFSHVLVPINISRCSRLDSVIEKIDCIDYGRTDCAQPMIYALQNQLEVDAFVVYTDNETWAGQIHPSQALVQYRKTTGINAKLIVVGMTATEFTIADSSDPGMLDVVGFDASCPAVMADFARN